MKSLKSIDTISSRKSSAHTGHRARLRQQYLRYGLESLQPHQVLELLLTYSIPRRDVNEDAHALLDRFGSLSGVLDAPRDELCEVAGIGPESAAFLTLLPELFRLYAQDKCITDDTMNTAAKITAYLQTLFIGVTNEQVYLLLFDNGMHLIDCTCLAEGTPNCVHAEPRRIVERTLVKHASAAVLAHNHPGGLAVPSGADHQMTDEIACALDLIQVPLLEHFVVTETMCTPIVRHTRGMLRASPVTRESDERFWHRFYGDESDS